MSTEGAFVEIDNNKLPRDGLVMLGMKEALDKWIRELMTLAGHQKHQGVAKVMVEVAEGMTTERDSLAVALTRYAIQHGAGAIHTIRKD